MLARMLRLLTLLGLFFAASGEAAHFDAQYVARYGDANADGGSISFSVCEAG